MLPLTFQTLQLIYVWIFENSVDFGTKLFFLPASNGWQGGLYSAWKARGASFKEGWGRQPRCLATSWYQGESPGFIPWGVGRVTEREALLFAQRNCLFSLQHSLGQSSPAGLVAGSQPARHKKGGWVGCVLTDYLWLIERKSLCIFLEKCQGGCVDISIVFKNPNINNRKHWFDTTSTIGFASAQRQIMALLNVVNHNFLLLLPYTILPLSSFYCLLKASL